MSSNNQSSGTTQPSSILFFIAVGIGVIIALIFIFFSMRYYVRTKLGIYATARIASTNGNGIVLVSGDFAMQSYTAYHNDSDRIRRRRRRRYMKRRRLTEQEVDHLFPVRTYRDWLDGGAERDADNRDIHEQLKEENDDVIEEQNEHEVVNNAPTSTATIATTTTTTSTDNVNDKPSQPSQESEVTVDGTADTKTSEAIHQETVGTSSSAMQAAPQVALSTPTDHYDLGAALHYDSGTCAICIDTFEDEDQVRGLICGHVFHQGCLDPWLIKRKACCPMCKRDYYLKNNNSNSNDENNGEDDFNDDGNNSVNNHSEFQYATLSERVEEILGRNPAVEEIAKENMKRYLTLKWRFFWIIMGISRQDLINSAIVAEDTRRGEASQNQNQNQDIEATDAEQAPVTETAEMEPVSDEQRERDRARVEATV